MAGEIVPIGPGRPSRGDLPYYEGMHLADWIEEQRAEHKRLGNSAPLKRALNDAYEMLHGDDPDRPDPEKFATTLKRKFYPARRDLHVLQRVAEELNAIVPKQKQREK
ncbi:hypothetical protein [Mesorhizobium amorphae]|nr:hypothetical protein [Mesorhizobium amorphae]